MSLREVEDGWDYLLQPFLSAQGGEAETALGLLMTDYADAVIRGVVRSKLRSSLSYADASHLNQDAVEVYADVRAVIVGELQGLRSRPQERRIKDFCGYVATVAYHACYHYLRQKYPKRASLKNKLRYLLTRHTEFALWRGGGRGPLCGLAAWDGMAKAPTHTNLTMHVREALDSSPGSPLARGRSSGDPGVELLTAVFDGVGGPLELDELVDAVAELLEIDEGFGREEARGTKQTPDVRHVKGAPNAQTGVERRDYLGRLWAEIRQLPAAQRAALLLNLSDAQGRDCIALFPLTGVASVRDIAQALDIPAEQFAEMWDDLPLDDMIIAERLGVTRQQVINLRSSARSRLARRMRDL